MNDSVELFILRINKFIDKYYKCLLVKGLFLFVSSFLLSFVLLSSIEFLFGFHSYVRFFLLILLIVFNLSVLLYYVVFPFLRLFSIMPRMPLSEASRLIQSRNPQLKDTLTNIIELLKFDNSDLVSASIQQKINSVSHFDFTESLHFLPAKRQIYITSFFIFSFFLLLIIATPIFKVGAYNIFHWFESTSEELGLQFIVDESKLVVEEGSDFLIVSKVVGKKLPQNVFVNLGTDKYVMQNEADSLFTYLFKNVNNSFSFTLSSEEVRSKTFTVNVLKVPVVKNYNTNIYFPKYVNKRDTIVENQNILIVPQGTSLKQVFYGSNVDSLHIISMRDSSIFSLPGTDTFVFKTKILRDENYNVTLSNSNMIRDFINFKIVCVPDGYPEISVSKSNEQDNSNSITFDGYIKDDYGFEKMKLFVNGDEVVDTFDIPIFNNLSAQRIFYNYQCPVSSDITDKSLSFCFEVYDNDGVNGPKKTRSQIFDYTVKSISSQISDKEERYEEIFRNLELSKQLSNEIQFDISELRKKLLNNNLSEWEKNQMLQQITNKTNQLENLLNEAAKNQSAFDNSSNKVDQLVEKQNLISEMLNSLVDEELKQILKELSELASEQAQQYNSMSEDLKKDFGNFEKSIDKNLELLRKIKIEEGMKQLASNLDILSKKQENLKFSGASDSISNALDNQNQFFDDLQNQYKQLSEENKSLERPYNIGDFSEQFNKIDSLFKSEKQSLNNSDEQKFNNDTKENSRLIKQLSENLDQKLANSIADSEAVDSDALRQILDNLFEISFDQERVITDYENVNFSDPLYQERILDQSRLVDNFKMVRDSLYSLSRQSVYLGSHISQAAFLIEDEMEKSCLMLQERNTSRASRSQREVLKNTNDMILILSESLKNIENSSSGKSGQQMKRRKQKPKDRQQDLSEMRNAQEQLKNQMRDLLNQMKNGNQDKNNSELVKSLIQNEIYQQMLEQMMYNSDIDSQTAKLLQEVKNLMEKTHSDLANKKLSIQTVMRQQSIVNKLLEAENAEAERELDDKREAITAKNISGNRNENWQEDITFEKNMDVLKQTNLKLNSFYKSKFDEYLNSVNGMSNE